MLQTTEYIKFIPKGEAINLAGGNLIAVRDRLTQTEGSSYEGATQFALEMNMWIHFQYYLLLLVDAVPPELTDENGMVLDPEGAKLLSLLHWYQNEELQTIMSPMADAITQAIRDLEVGTRTFQMRALISADREEAVNKIIKLVKKYS